MKLIDQVISESTAKALCDSGVVISSMFVWMRYSENGFTLRELDRAKHISTFYPAPTLTELLDYLRKEYAGFYKSFYFSRFSREFFSREKPHEYLAALITALKKMENKEIIVFKECKFPFEVIATATNNLKKAFAFAATKINSPEQLPEPETIRNETNIPGSFKHRKNRR